MATTVCQETQQTLQEDDAYMSTTPNRREVADVLAPMGFVSESQDIVPLKEEQPYPTQETCKGKLILVQNK